MDHKNVNHALKKVLLPEQKVKRDHNQTIKRRLLLVEDSLFLFLFSSAGGNRHPCEMDSILA